MKKVIAICLAIFLFLPSQVFAKPDNGGNNKCTIQGQKDFTIAFDAEGPSLGQFLMLDQGKHGYVAWYTDEAKIPAEHQNLGRGYLETELEEGKIYNILITHKFDQETQTGTLVYYRKLSSEPELSYIIKAGAIADLHNGQYSLVGVGILNNECVQEYLPPVTPEFNDVCESFNSVIQTWYDDEGGGNGRLYISGSAQIKGAATNLTTGQRIVGFEEGNVYGDLTGSAPDWEQQINAGCDSERCWGDASLRVPRQSLVSFPYSSGKQSIWVGSSETWDKGLHVEGLLSVGGTLTLTTGTYWVDRVEVIASGRIVVPEGEEVILNVKELSVDGFLGMDIADIENNSRYDGYLRVNVYDSTSNGPVKVSFNGSATFIGLLYSEASMQISRAKIYGAVTAVGVQLYNSAQIVASSSCMDPTPTDDNYTLVLVPELDIALICEDITPTVSVMNNGQLASEFAGTVVVTIDGVEQSYSGASNQFTVQSDGASKTVSVTTYIQGEQDSSSVSGRYEFVPYKFSAADQYVVANKPQQVEVKALACDDNGGVVDAGYVGSPAIQSSWVSPSSGASGSFTYAPEFTSGTTSSELVLDDAGKMEVSLEDTNFDCSGLTGCPIEGRGALKGSFMIYSRPWTFALCSTNNTDIDTATGTSVAGNAFVAAGEEFDVRVLPIKYQAASSGEVETNSAWCGASNITSNFFVDNAFSNNVKLSSEVASPESHISSVLIASNDGLIQSRVNSDKVYNFTRLYWNDVGSLKVMVSTENYSPTCSSPIGLEAWYECTQLGFRNIGRFYPHHFKLDSNSWTAVDGQNDVNYMGQSFALAEVYVSPYAKGANTPVSNYHLFDNSFVAQFAVVDDEEIENRLFLDTELGSWGVSTSTSLWSLNDDSAYVSKLIAPNGPFNTNDVNSVSSMFGLIVSGTDPVQFYNSDGSDVSITQTLTQQPPVRFGRIQLDDVGGSQGAKLTVPLRVEYWNGKRFIQNTEDDGTIVNAALEKQELIWSSNGAGCDVTVAVVEDDRTKPEGYDMLPDAQVTQGRLPNALNERLLAYQNCVSPTRQQSEVWLNLQQFGSNIPWLKYDWDNDGEEENPSSVVTFGIYRGNDRVIYRGEPGLTGQ